MVTLSRFWLAAVTLIVLICVVNMASPPTAGADGDLRTRYERVRKYMREADVLSIVGRPQEADAIPYIDPTLAKEEEVDHTQAPSVLEVYFWDVKRYPFNFKDRSAAVTKTYTWQEAPYVVQIVMMRRYNARYHQTLNGLVDRGADAPIWSEDWFVGQADIQDLAVYTAWKNELNRLQGSWLTRSFISDGRTVVSENAPLKNGKLRKLIYEGDTWSMAEGDAIIARGFVRIDPSKAPKKIEMMDESGEYGHMKQGIYRLTGDELKYCIVPAGLRTPTDFDSKPGTQCSLLVATRENR